MQARWIGFGKIELDGERYTHDVVIDAGEVRKRKKGPSKELHGEYGHTPLSGREEIPWGGKRLIVGTGADGRLPVLPEVYQEAERRGIDVVATPTREAIELLREAEREDVRAVLHITC
jgi:hypothetical protein